MSIDTTHWPFPGQEHLPPPVYDLPPPRFSPGDLVKTRWGNATVIKVCAWPMNAGRAYLVKHTWSQAPEGFGHTFGENAIELRQKAEPTPINTPASAPQLELFE
ncbi:hypothetical protein LNV47_22555 [Paucibacter sp. DJ4R-1]|nr:hypothetical protein [Paucibacter sp. DJ4R-1]